MNAPSDESKRRTNPLLDGDEFQIAAEPAKPRVVPAYVEKHLKNIEEKRVSAAEELPPQPRWPMVEGILAFPFYLNSLGAWMAISAGLMATGWLLMFWWAYGAVIGLSGAWYLGLPACSGGLLTFGYAASCCLTIIEKTSSGWTSFEVTSGSEWKEWIWNFAHILVIFSQAAIVGYIAYIITGSTSWLTMAVVTLFAFPMVLLGALAADDAWVPLAIGSVIRSLVLAWWAWALFYLITIPMVVGLAMIVKSEIVGHTPWLVPLYTAPLLGYIIMVYARLIGRLGACIDSAASKLSDEGDDDEDS